MREARRREFDVIAITNHDTSTYSPQLAGFAGSLDILLIPGVELTVQGVHVLVVGDLSRLEGVRRLEDLYRVKSERTLLVAPHPFFPASKGMGALLYRHRDLFDALEICQCYTPWLDYNRPAVRLAREAGLPLAAFSDTHKLWQFGKSYSLIMADRSLEGIVSAVRCGDIEPVTRPLGMFDAMRYGVWVLPAVARAVFGGKRAIEPASRKFAPANSLPNTRTSRNDLV
ncbi:MAG: PHP-associated domain-containing protein [Candidatus Glassbacteria bacterium]